MACDRIERYDSTGVRWRTRRYVLAIGRLVLEQCWRGEAPGYVLEGASREWYESGQLKEEVQYSNGDLVGELRTFYANGQRRRVQSFGVLTGSSYCFDAAGRPRASCPPYHQFAQPRSRGRGVEQFLGVVQAGYAAGLPAGSPKRCGCTTPFGSIRPGRSATGGC